MRSRSCVWSISVSSSSIHHLLLLLLLRNEEEAQFDLCSRFCFGWPENLKIGTHPPPSLLMTTIKTRYDYCSTFLPWLCVACVVRRESWDLSLEIVRIDCQKWNWTHILHATQEKYRWFIPAEPENFLGSHFLFFFSCHSHTFCSGTQFQVEFFNDKKKKKNMATYYFFLTCQTLGRLLSNCFILEHRTTKNSFFFFKIEEKGWRMSRGTSKWLS